MRGKLRLRSGLDQQVGQSDIVTYLVMNGFGCIGRREEMQLIGLNFFYIQPKRSDRKEFDAAKPTDIDPVNISDGKNLLDR